ncbi:hypothetical protein J3F84DRAFT_112209 [Trichoderma pleuroticola]
MSWTLQPRCYKLPAPMSRPIALQHQQSSLQAQPLFLSLSLPAPPHPFPLPFFPFFLRLVLFLLKYGGTHESPQTRESRCLAPVLVLVLRTRTGNLEVLSPVTTYTDVLVLVLRTGIHDRFRDHGPETTDGQHSTWRIMSRAQVANSVPVTRVALVPTFPLLCWPRHSGTPSPSTSPAGWGGFVFTRLLRIEFSYCYLLQYLSINLSALFSSSIYSKNKWAFAAGLCCACKPFSESPSNAMRRFVRPRRGDYRIRPCQSVYCLLF